MDVLSPRCPPRCVHLSRSGYKLARGRPGVESVTFLECFRGFLGSCTHLRSRLSPKKTKTTQRLFKKKKKKEKEKCPNYRRSSFHPIDEMYSEKQVYFVNIVYIFILLIHCKWRVNAPLPTQKNTYWKRFM